MNKKHFIVAVFAALGMAFSANGQKKVGSNPTTINANSVLEMEATNKGMLLPRVALTATDNIAPLTAHIAGMVVYNTATVGTGVTGVVPGYYYNDGTQWVRLAAGGNGGNVSLPVTNLVSNNSPVGNTPGQLLYNTNPNIGLPVGPVYWDGNNWIPINPTATEPWYNVATNAGATANTQNIYQMGNVGIGTAPRESFDIRKGIAFHTGGNLAMFFNGYYDGGFKHAGYGGSNYAGVLDFGAGTGDMYFKTSEAAGAEGTAVVGKTLLSLRQSGNVGIGTTNPATLLEVSGSTTPTLTLRNTSAVGGEGTAKISFNIASGVSKAEITAIDRTVGAGGAWNGALAFNTSDNGSSIERMRINEYGLVGIGTTAPTQRLHVDGKLAVGAGGTSAPGTWSTNGSDIILNTGTFNSQILLRPNGDGSTANQFVIQPVGHSFFGSDGLEKVRITPNGNVGIGTLSPAAKLDVLGKFNVVDNSLNINTYSDGTAGVFSINSSSNEAPRIRSARNNTPNWDINMGDDISFNYFTSFPTSAPILYVKGTGNVGIGTTTPTMKLDVNGALTVRGDAVTNAVDHVTNITIVGNQGTPTAGEIRFGDGTGWKMNFAQAANDGAAKLMTLTDSGQLGIGTTTPAATLDVNGQVKISGGTPGAGKVLTSDANGLATWETLNTSRSSIGIITADYTVTAADATILCNVPVAGMTLTLPDANANLGKIITIRKIDNDADVLTFSPAINYSTTETITTLNFVKTLTVQSVGGAWWVIN